MLIFTGRTGGIMLNLDSKRLQVEIDQDMNRFIDLIVYQYELLVANGFPQDVALRLIELSQEAKRLYDADIQCGGKR